MKKYLIKRMGMMLITLFLITLLTFILMHAVPGGPFNGEKQVSKAVMDALNEKYKLNDPLWKQFIDYVSGLLRFDLGPSFKYQGKTVNDFIENGFPYSAKLGGITLIFVLLASIPMGIISALKNGKWQDMLLMAIATIGVTIPSFVIATALIYIFSFKLQWTPVYGVDTWKGYILPVVAMGGYSVSFLARLMRSYLLGTDHLGRDILSRLMYGTRISLLVAFIAAMVNMVIGIFYGGISGYLGGQTDAVMMLIVDIISTIPLTLYVILIKVCLDDGFLSIVIALSSVYWVDMARVVR